MKSYGIIVALLCVVSTTCIAQSTEPDIRKYVAQVNNGNVDDVRRELPSLLTKYPNNPGVMYLQGLVSREGSEAIRTYQSIVDNFPTSEWADDALYRVYQFYYALGLYRTAEIKMKQLVEKYPDSPFAKGGTEAAAAQKAAPVEEPKLDVPAPAETHPQTPPPAAQPSTEPAAADTTMAARFVLQVGAFGVQNNAETLKDRFEAAGYPVEMISKVKDTRALFLVWVGNYATYEEARTAGQDVKRKMGLDAIVISR
jgi:cell division septation protein DedD